MKICIPVIGKNVALANLIDDDFYKANFYCVFDPDSGLKEVMTKDELTAVFGIDLLKADQDNVIKIVISPNIRTMAYKILSDNGIRVLKPLGKYVDENILLFKYNQLKEHDAASVESPKGCSSGCSSCSSCN